MACPRCGSNERDQFSSEGETYYCYGCGECYFVAGDVVQLCKQPQVKGGFLVPDKMGEELQRFMQKSEVHWVGEEKPERPPIWPPSVDWQREETELWWIQVAGVMFVVAVAAVLMLAVVFPK